MRVNTTKSTADFFEILCVFVVTGVTTTTSTAVHNYHLESGFTKEFLEFVWSEQLVLDGQAFF